MDINQVHQPEKYNIYNNLPALLNIIQMFSSRNNCCKELFPHVLCVNKKNVTFKGNFHQHLFVSSWLSDLVSLSFSFSFEARAMEICLRAWESLVAAHLQLEMLIVSAGSTASKNSSHKDGSEASVHHKSRKQMIMEKLREQLFRAKAFLLKRYWRGRGSSRSLIRKKWVKFIFALIVCACVCVCEREREESWPIMMPQGGKSHRWLSGLKLSEH